MACFTGKISAKFKKGVNHHIITQVLGQKYPNFGKNWRPWGALKWREKSEKPFFSPVLTHKNLHRAPNGFKINVHSRHCFQKKYFGRSYGPKDDGTSSPNSRRPASQFPSKCAKISPGAPEPRYMPYGDSNRECDLIG